MTVELKHGMMVDGHLGGYVPGGDPDTTTPSLWRWLVGNLAAYRVLDVGAGDGVALDGFKQAGADYVMGVDGMSVAHPDVMTHDFTTGPWVPVAPFDLAYCVETVEHIEERFLPNLMAALTGGKWIAMTHAVPGQAGWHHVNCRTSDYWIGAFAAVGFQHDEGLSRAARETAAFDRPSSYFAKTGKVFRRVT